MDNLNYESPAARLMVEQGLFRDEPFVLLDAGCSGGIDEVWRIFGSSLVAHGFDPNAEDCRRLQLAEPNPNVHYHAACVGLPDGHEFHRKKAAAAPSPCSYWEIMFGRSSGKAHTTHPTPPPPPDCEVSTSGPAAPVEPPLPKVSLDDFVSRQQLSNVDFIKVDTDGADLEVLLSAEPCIGKFGVLGALVECQYQGEDDETSNTFHNIDRLMKRHGLMIFSMSVFSFSRAALPAPYLYPNFAQTTFGQPVFGDVAFLRDPLWPRIGMPAELPFTKLLKLICLYEFFHVPDCAAELILANRSRIAEAIDPDRLLDLLTPPLGGRKVTYAEYTAAVAADPQGLLDRARDFTDDALDRSLRQRVPDGVGAAWPLSEETVIEPGNPTRIVTPPRAWTYSAEFPISVPNEVPGQVYVRIRAQVIAGACAFGVLDRQGKFQLRRVLASSLEPRTIFLRVSDRSQVKCVVLEKASVDDQPVEVMLSEMSVQTDCAFDETLISRKPANGGARTWRDRLRSIV